MVSVLLVFRNLVCLLVWSVRAISGDNWIWLILLSLAIRSILPLSVVGACPFGGSRAGWSSRAPAFLWCALQKISSDRVLFFLSLPLFFLYLASSTALLLKITPWTLKRSGTRS